MAANVAAFLTAVLAVAENHDMALRNRNSSKPVPAPAEAAHCSPWALSVAPISGQPSCPIGRADSHAAAVFTPGNKRVLQAIAVITIYKSGFESGLPC